MSNATFARSDIGALAETASVVPRATDMQPVVVKSVEQVFHGYVANAPLSYALFRAAELMPLARRRLQSPILDLGCGVGDFAAMAVNGTLDMGVDCHRGRIARTARRGDYRQLLCADARCLPFPSSTFETVISISALEHMADPANVLVEAFRVLRPGGVLLATVVLDDIHQYLFYPTLLNRARLHWPAMVYQRLHNWAFTHRTLMPAGIWLEWVKQAGFSMNEALRVVSPRLTCSFDARLPWAIPYRLLRSTIPTLISRGASRQSQLWQRWRSQIEAATADGCVLYIAATKPGGDYARTIS